MIASLTVALALFAKSACKLFAHEPSLKVVALTFDDGPHPIYTPKVLEILRRYKV
ncbi:MAG: polysaccharide deacetylase family protein, partial [Armatimonadota bacterium]